MSIQKGIRLLLMAGFNDCIFSFGINRTIIDCYCLFKFLYGDSEEGVH